MSSYTEISSPYLVSAILLACATFESSLVVPSSEQHRKNRRVESTRPNDTLPGTHLGESLICDRYFGPAEIPEVLKV